MTRNQSQLLLMHYGIEAAARKNPDKIAVIQGNKSLTFAELDARANQTANALMAGGLRKGDRAVVNLLNCIEYPEIIYGCSKAGIELVPISFLLAPPEVEYIVNHCEAKAVFFSSMLSEVVEKIRSNTPQVKMMLSVGGESSIGEEYTSWREKASKEKPEAEVAESDVFYIGYTSGTTGRPKGAVISHRSRLLICWAGAVEYNTGANEVNLTVAPIYHAAPIAFLLLNLYFGNTVVVLASFEPESFLTAIAEHKVTNMFVVPAMLNAVAMLPDAVREKFDISSLKTIISAGSPLPTKVKERTLEFFKDAGLHEFYGSTEAPLNTSLRPEDQRRKTKCCGKPLTGWEVVLLDDKRQPVGRAGEVGEVFVRGDYMFDGYLNNPEATAGAFHEGWFSAGDLGRMDEEGYLYIVDRKKDMIISGGVNVYPVEIEDCLMHHPAVVDAAVIGVPDERWGEAVRAVVQLREGEEVSEEEIMGFCDGRIAKYKKPKSVVFTPGIPKNPSGKTLKTTLRKLFGAPSDS